MVYYDLSNDFIYEDKTYIPSIGMTKDYGLRRSSTPGGFDLVEVGGFIQARYQRGPEGGENYISLG